MSSIPLVVRMTLAPAFNIIPIRSLVMSDSLHHSPPPPPLTSIFSLLPVYPPPPHPLPSRPNLSRILSSSLGSLTSTWMPICILLFWRLKSRHAIFAGLTRVGMPSDARAHASAYPFNKALSRALFP